MAVRKEMRMKTQHDVWEFLCKSNGARDLLQYYVHNPNDVAKAFWHGVLTVLEIEGKITEEEANNIWSEVIGV